MWALACATLERIISNTGYDGTAKRAERALKRGVLYENRVSSHQLCFQRCRRP